MSSGSQSAVVGASARPWSRVVGLGSVYAKTVRDSRRAGLVVGLLGGGFMLLTAAPYGVEFTTEASRAQFAASMTALPPVFQGLLGDPINLETLGGFVSWRVGNFLPVLLGLWPVLALSGTLAGEAARGSLDLVVATQHSRRSIAIQKAAGHITVLIVAMLIAGLLLYAAGQAFATVPGDEISLAAAFGQVTLYGLLMLAAGGLAFATAPFVGRTRAAAFGLVALFGMYLVSSYASLAPALDALSPISWYAWTSGHRPIAGVTDWPSVGLLAVVVLALLAIGIVAFDRRDVGSSSALSWLRFPAMPAGLRGPFTRQLADRAAVALAWGTGVGLYGALIASSSEAFVDMLSQSPGLVEMVRIIYPDLDLTQPSGLLQLAFFAFGSLMLGLAGATFLAGWSSDEGRRRLDLVLTTPVSRAGWAIRSGLGVMAAVALAVLPLGLLVAITIASQSGDVAAPLLGMVVLGVVVAGQVGIGFAVGGLVRSSLAAPVTAAVVLAMFILDALGPALDLPQVVLELSIYQHVGQPIAGSIEPLGVVISAGLAIGGLMIGAWGMSRRDIGR